MTGRDTEIVRHLGEDDLDRLLTQTDSEKVSERLTFLTRLSKSATLEDTADDIGMSQSTGSRWATLWNKGGLGLLAPSFGGDGVPENLLRNSIQNLVIEYLLILLRRTDDLKRFTEYYSQGDLRADLGFVRPPCAAV